MAGSELLEQLKGASFVRIAAALGIAATVSISLYLALSSANSVAGKEAGSIYSQRVAKNGARVFQEVDQSLSAVAMKFTVPVSDAIADQTRFSSAAREFFRRTTSVHALVMFRASSSAEQASALAQNVAANISKFGEGDAGFFLSASNVATRDGNRPGVFPLLGPAGTLPEQLTAGERTRQALREALLGSQPVASGFFTHDARGIISVPGVQRGANGSHAFWRFVPVRTTNPITGADQLIGVAGALVDAQEVLAQLATGPAQLIGPIEISSLPDPAAGTLTDGMTQIGLPLGNQGLVVAVPSSAATSMSVVEKMLAFFGGIAAGLAVTYAMHRENRSRVDAEQLLLKSRRSFKKRTAELKRSEERFRRLAESTNVVPWAADLSDQRFTYIGPQIQKMTGYPVSSWCAAGFWVGHVHPEDRHRTFVDGFKGLDDGEYATIEYRIRSADGKIIHIRNMLTVAPKKDGGRIAQGYMLDITEMKTAQVKLDEARHQAEEANRSKSEFLANMSHELRTPLNAVIGFAEVMKDELFGPIGERYKDYAESVHSSGKHLLDLINDVLDLSKIEAGKIELIEEETDLGALLSKCRTVLHERASSVGLHIRLEIPAPLPMANVDSRRLKQIILNLMSNSIKFTPPGGRITLRGELLAPRGLRLSVVDTGIGMSKDELQIALEQFGQIDSELSRQHNGTGLGLPITRSLIELHGGELEVESRKGVGTTVHVWLPMQRLSGIAGTLANDDKPSKPRKTG